MITTSDFYAENIYSKWVDLVCSAKESIVIFSPYLNDKAKSLLTHPEIDKSINKTIVTCLTEEIIFEHPYQVKTLIGCAESGVNIYSLKDLHAKVLLVDNHILTMGSQNFTSKGTVNKEVSYASNISFVDSEVLKTLKNWIKSAEKIDLELLRRIQLLLHGFENKREKLVTKLGEEIESIKDKITSENIEKLERNTRFRIVDYWGDLELIKIKNSYYSLKSESNLLNWQRIINDKDVKVFTISKAYFYPIYNNETREFAFVRVCKKFISYVRYKVSLESELIILDLSYIVSVNCYFDEDAKSNICITLKNEDVDIAQLYFNFNGKKFIFKKGNELKSEKRQSLVTYFRHMKNRAELLRKILGGFKYERLGRENLNIEDFVEHRFYPFDLSIVACYGMPVLLLD